MQNLEPRVHKTLEKVFKEMENVAARALRCEGFAASKQRHARALALRYQGQSFELEIKLTGEDIEESFHRAHRERYGYAQEGNVVEVVAAHVRSSGLVGTAREVRSSARRKKGIAKPSRFTEAYLEGKKTKVAVYDRDRLSAGEQLRVPCIVTEYSTTTMVPNDTVAKVDMFGNVIIQVGGLSQVRKSRR